MFTYDALLKIKNNPMAVLKSVPQYNADISKAYILTVGLHYASQSLLQNSSLSVIPSAASAASTVLFQAAFWSNEHVMSAVNQVAMTVNTYLPDPIKEVINPNALASAQEEQAEALSHKMN